MENMAKVIQGNFTQKKKKTGESGGKAKTLPAYQLKISLLGSEPLIWRRILVPGSMTLARLHEVIQLCMGWTDTHLHQFMVGNAFYAPPEEEEDWEEIGAHDEAAFTLADLEADMRTHCMYDYDFGDNWQHEITLEKIIPPDEKPAGHAVLLAGERACPPEDIGGIPGYEDFLDAIQDPKSEEHKELLEWYGSDDFDPDFFETEKINRLLKKMK